MGYRFCYYSTACNLKGEVRLQDGNSHFSGRVEVCYHLFWGTVCKHKWNLNNAVVVCKQLGNSGQHASVNMNIPGGVGNIWMDDIVCEGTESKIDQCNSTLPGIHKSSCVHDQDAGVSCFSKFKTFRYRFNLDYVRSLHISVSPIFVEAVIKLCIYIYISDEVAFLDESYEIAKGQKIKFELTLKRASDVVVTVFFSTIDGTALGKFFGVVLNSTMWVR